ncbi:MAG: DUF6152 family protein [Pseudomonadales bacterium]|nr:DUF6152 family protein [Pseudomonadales bacterium]MDP6472137.1 DUF6152 family protein [Pseudomonadales bacterium]MDP6826611.1 DUF6152 family protein [Pseudomonadales bacterium]MDP6970118.1 DUF6152 family protein [Pseudomonadales bacterium]
MTRADRCFISLIALTSGLAMLPPGVHAHHAFSSEFDANRPFLVQGKVVKIEWINPHSWIHVDVPQDDGTVVPWMMEGGTPNSLLRAGLTRKALTVGAQIVVRGYQSKDPDCEPKCRGSGRDITFPGGQRLFMGSSGTGAPRDGADPNERSVDQALPEQ